MWDWTGRELYEQVSGENMARGIPISEIFLSFVTSQGGISSFS